MKHIKYIIGALLVCAVLMTFTACGEKAEYPLESSENVHTIVLVSDTQRYAQQEKDTNMAMIQALADSRDEYNIEYVIHAGDLVQSPEKDDEWQAARAAMDQLDGVIPYGVLAGNHDQLTGDERFTAYGQYFGDASYRDCAYFGGSFENCRAHYQLVTIGSKEFVVVYISDDPSKAAVEFANQAFAKFGDRTGILVTHKYLKIDCSPDEMGEYMLEHIVKPNPNVAMVLCGHESAVGYLATALEDGRTVLQIMANYQDANNGSMLYLQINEADRTLTGISYSPVKDTYDGYKDQTDDQFIVDLPW